MSYTSATQVMVIEIWDPESYANVDVAHMTYMHDTTSWDAAYLEFVAGGSLAAAVDPATKDIIVQTMMDAYAAAIAAGSVPAPIPPLFDPIP